MCKDVTMYKPGEIKGIVMSDKTPLSKDLSKDWHICSYEEAVNNLDVYKN